MWKFLRKEAHSFLPNQKSLSQTRDISLRSWPSWITVGSSSVTSLVRKWIHWYQNSTCKILPVFIIASLIAKQKGSDKYKSFCGEELILNGIFQRFHIRSNDVTELETILLLFRMVNFEGLCIEFETSFFDSVKRSVFLSFRTFTYLKISKQFFGVPYL